MRLPRTTTAAGPKSGVKPVIATARKTLLPILSAKNFTPVTVQFVIGLNKIPSVVQPIAILSEKLSWAKLLLRPRPIARTATASGKTAPVFTRPFRAKAWPVRPRPPAVGNTAAMPVPILTPRFLPILKAARPWVGSLVRFQARPCPWPAIQLKASFMMILSQAKEW